MDIIFNRLKTLAFTLIIMVLTSLITVTSFGGIVLPELDDGKDEDIELTRIEAKNPSKNGFTVEFTVNDGAMNKNTQITYAYTIFESLVIKNYNIGYDSIIPTTKTKQLSSLTRVSTARDKNVYSVYIEEALTQYPSTLYVYAMLKTQDGESEVMGCQLKMDRTMIYQVIYPYYAPATPAPTALPTFMPTTVPTWEPVPTGTVTPTTQPTLTPMPAALGKVSFIFASYYNTAAIDKSGGLWIWGDNSYGQLGNGTNGADTEKSIPQNIKSGTQFKVISTSYIGAAAIDGNGGLWAWGDNWSGELGDGTYVGKNTPQNIMPGTRFASISCGIIHTAAIDDIGSLWTWGNNEFGQLGDGTDIPSKSTPQQIMNGTGFAQVSCGTFHSAAIDKNGGLWTWGSNQNGELGNGTNINNGTPQNIMPGTSFKAVSTGEYYTAAIDVNGGLWAWGSNDSGKLGIGTYDDKNTPQNVMPGTSFTAVSCGFFHTAAIDIGGNLWIWGNNRVGQLGNGTNDDINIPQNIMPGTRFTAISSGGSHTAAIDVNDDLWVTGFNGFGQLGNGTNISTNIPVRITY